ncbi:MAG TPA: pseudouridine synthase [Chroococcales cyanobacterium]
MGNKRTAGADRGQFRLNRAIAATGFCSRRQADQLIAAGRIKVNRLRITDFNYLVDLGRDRLFVDGKPIAAKTCEYILIYKPRGVVTTMRDEKGRTTVVELLPRELRHLKPVGRLDMDSEGLLLLTNDGDLAQHLAHPSNHIFKFYKVWVDGQVSDEFLDAMCEGVRLDDGMTLPARVRLIKRNEDESQFEIGIQEGRNRQIRRMCATLGYPVIRLVRVAIGELQLRLMEPGQWRHLTKAELDKLRVSQGE